MTAARAFTLAAATVTMVAAAASSDTSSMAASVRAARPSFCPAKRHALDGVYHPSRLVILKVCQRASGVIALIRPRESDGDLHILLRLDAAYASLINPGNKAKQRGDLVVELMPRDGGHLPRPVVGDRVTLVGAWVTDTEHGWNELHPVWREVLNGSVYTSGPQNGGSPATDRSSNAAADCRDHGHLCTGYGP